MPFVKIYLAEGSTEEYRRTLGDQVHEAMVATISCPPLDRFQVVHEVGRGNFLYTPEYLGIPHGERLTVIQITLNEGRGVELKKALYAEICRRLHETLGIPAEDVLINLVEVKKENWSFGNGVAQYA